MQDQVDKLTALLNEALAILREINHPIQKTFNPSNDDKWPLAVKSYQICNPDSDADKTERAEGIVDILLNSHIKKQKSFLDFGCGEGHVVYAARHKFTSVTGYDIIKSGSLTWESDPLLTTDFNNVISRGPFDIILMYDVLDHVEKETPIDVLKKIRSLCHLGSKIIIRFHPWCGRHGGHLYNSINKAFAHLVLNDEEIQKLQPKTFPTIKVIHPIREYTQWIQASGFTIEHEPRIEKTPVESFFMENNVIAEMIKTHWKDSHEPELANGHQFPIFQLEQDFLDYVLVPK